MRRLRRWSIPRVWVYPVVVIAVFGVLVACGVSGTSSGALHSFVYGTDDPRVKVGSVQAVRSDEWLTATPAVIGQVQTGYHAVNHSYAGGQNLTFTLDVPFRQWPILARPESWGFAALPLDQAMAWRWWLPGLAILLASYLLTLTLAPTRRLLGALVGVCIVFSPMMQWWWMPGYLMPVASALAGAAATIRIFTARGVRLQLAWAALLAWSIAIFGLTLYPPSMISALLPVLGLTAGWLVQRARERSWAVMIRPALAAVLGLSVGVLWILVFLLTRWDVVQTIQHTAYPGARVVPTGTSSVDRIMVGLFSGRLLDNKVAADPTALSPFGGNQSEASAFVLVGLFVIPLAVAQLVRARRQQQRMSGPILGLLVIIAVMFLDLLVSGLPLLAKLTGLFLVTPGRLGFGLGLASLLLSLLVVLESSRLEWRPIRAVALLAGGLTLLLLLGEVAHVESVDPGLAHHDAIVVMTVVAVAISTALLWRGKVLGIGVMAALSLRLGAPVNPVVVGQFDVRDTAVGHAIMDVDAAAPGGWVSTAGLISGALLEETGVRTYAGTFNYPIFSNWTDLDPDGHQRNVYNRFAYVQFDTAATSLTNPSPDAVTVPFDACGRFAQRRVRHVLALTPIQSPCLSVPRSIASGRMTFFIYDVQGPRVSGGERPTG